MTVIIIIWDKQKKAKLSEISLTLSLTLLRVKTGVMLERVTVSQELKSLRDEGQVRFSK